MSTPIDPPRPPAQPQFRSKVPAGIRPATGARTPPGNSTNLPTEPIAAIGDAFVAFPAPAGTVMALRGLSLTIAPGERVLVQGPNGSGKSTMLRLLTGEQDATAGTVVVGGTELGRLTAAARRRWRGRGVGLVDQYARRALLPEWPVRDNVALQLRLVGVGTTAARRRAAQVLDRLGLTGLAHRRIATLSGGEAQRVAIAAALAHDPLLLLADEPTGELDDAAARDVCELLAAAGGSGGTALLLVSHDLRAADLVDRAIRIRDGRLAEQWHPAAGRGEEQVLDDRGWLRLPTAVLDTLPPGPTPIRAESVNDGTIRLRPHTSEPNRLAATASGAGGGDPPGSAAGPVAILPAITESATDRPPLLQLTGIGVTIGPHDGGRALIAGLDLTLCPGDWVAVRGPSGSGKSTLLSLAAGLTDATVGAVRIGDIELGPLSRTARAELRSRMLAVALQSTYLADALTVAENLAVTRAVRGPTDRYGPDRTDGPTYPDPAQLVDDLSLTRLTHQPVRTLSGGERQRVALARCLTARAPLLILDEPTSQQDDASAARVITVLRAAVAAGRAVLTATHDPALTAAAHRVIDLALVSS